MKRSNNSGAALLHRAQVRAALNRIEAFDYAPRQSDGLHERISMFNADIATEAFFSTPLTDYAVDFSDMADLDAELEFFAPGVEVTPRFEYSVHDSAEAFLSDGDDDERPAKTDFKEIEETESKVNAATVNRGLQITLDMDKIRGRKDWEEHYTQKLLRRIKRNQLRRAVALISAAATNTAKTWDTSAGKDPDQDVITERVVSGDLSGISFNRVGYGDTAWSKRGISHRAQNSAGGFASAMLTPETLAGILGVDEVIKSNARYTSSANAKSQILGNLVLMFNASAGVDTEDSSNIKRFYSMGAPEEGGGIYQVYSARISAKRHVIAVGHYEKQAITSTLGIRKFTVS
jgi:hypothetical protein